MKRPIALFQWLTMAALADWMITRTLTRAGIFIPKTPFFIQLYQTLTELGQIASNFAGLMAFVLIAWIIRQTWRSKSKRLLAGLLGILAGLSLVFLIQPPGGWLLLMKHLIYIVCVGWLGSSLFKQRPLFALPVGALLFGGLYQTIPAIYELTNWPGPPPFIGVFFNLGELLVVGSSLAFWWYWGRGRSGRAWLWATLPALAFCGMAISISAMTGILSIWSIGLTLYLPWPFYALSLWLIGVTLIHDFQQGELQRVVIILLLAAGGYAPQLSAQVFYGLIGLWLLVNMEEKTSSDHEAYYSQPSSLITTPVMEQN